MSKSKRTISADLAKKPKKTKPEFLLAKSVQSQLPLAEREHASESLWQKSNGKCALCGLPLDLATKDSVVADHYVPQAKDGATVLSNLYLAHRVCNSSRQHLDFHVARPLIMFRSVAERGGTTFDGVLDSFVEGEKRALVEYAVDKSHAEITFGHHKVTLPLFTDPATKVAYFFCEVPVSHIHNDVRIQPRMIMPGHVRRLALDFLARPVHEPSNCRLEMQSARTARLLQFDGQHKTTAQILIGRTAVPVKVYVSPSIDMLQALVIKIQQEIKKQPLTKSETLAKVSDVMGRILDGYSEKAGRHRSEQGLVASQPKAEQKSVKKLYFDDLRNAIFFDPENQLSAAVGATAKARPTTDKVVIDKIISPLLYTKLLESDLDESGERDQERKNITFVLNTLAERMLPHGWDNPGNTIQRLRAQNFFYQGSIGWWMSEILEPSFRYILMAIGKEKPLLLKSLEESQKEQVLTLVEKLCGWPIWSTEEPDQVKAMRSNTVKNVADVFGDFTMRRLLEESGIA